MIHNNRLSIGNKGKNRYQCLKFDINQKNRRKDPIIFIKFYLKLLAALCNNYVKRILTKLKIIINVQAIK